MLNRPFRNVGELGYAFRDLPWKTLDFFSDKSADAGLLDIFTINDGPALFDANGNFTGMGALPTFAYILRDRIRPTDAKDFVRLGLRTGTYTRGA